MQTTPILKHEALQFIPAVQPVVTDLNEIFNTTNTNALWTRTVNVSGVKVQRIFRDKQFILVGPDADHTVLVQATESPGQIKEGESVDVAGMIDDLGADLSQWNVASEDRKMMSGHSIFVRATSIRPSAVK